MATLNGSITCPERPELTVTLEALRRPAEAAMDSAAEMTAAYAALREAVLGFLQAIRNLDALTGGRAMNHYEGWFFDTYLECDAENDEEARATMKRLLLEMIEVDDDPVVFWENNEGESDELSQAD